MKKVLSLLLVSSSLFSMQLDTVSSKSKSNKRRIEPSSVFVPNKLGSVELYHGKKGFSVHQDHKKHKIQKCFTDSMCVTLPKNN